MTLTVAYVTLTIPELGQASQCEVKRGETHGRFEGVPPGVGHLHLTTLLNTEPEDVDFLTFSPNGTIDMSDL